MTQPSNIRHLGIEVDVPLTPVSVNRLAQATAKVKQAQQEFLAMLDVILGAMGVEGEVRGYDLQAGTVKVIVPRTLPDSAPEPVEEPEPDFYNDPIPDPADYDLS